MEFLLLEDDSGALLLEDDSGELLLETSAEGIANAIFYVKA